MGKIKNTNMNNPKTFNILEIPLIITKRWFFIILFTFIFFIISIIYSGIIKEKFKSSVEIEFRDGSKNSVMGSLLERQLGVIDNYTNSLKMFINEAEIYAHIAETPRIIDKIIKNNNLNEKYKLNTMFSLRKRFKTKLKVYVNDLGLLEISYQDEDKNLAYKIIVSYIEELENYYRWRSQEVTKSILIEINSILDQIKGEIFEAKNKLKEFQEKYGIFDIDSYATNLANQISELKMQLIQAELEYKTKYEEYKKLGTVNTRELKIYQDKISIIEKELDQMKNISQNSHIAYNDLPKINLEYMEINTNLKSLYQIYEQLRLVYNITKLNINKDVESMVIVNEPEIAEYKFYPYRRQIVIRNTLIAFIFAIFLCFIIDFFERSLKNEEDREILLKIKKQLFFIEKIENIFNKKKKQKS